MRRSFHAGALVIYCTWMALTVIGSVAAFAKTDYDTMNGSIGEEFFRNS